MRLRHFIYYLLYVVAVIALSVVIILAFHPHIGEKSKSPSSHKSGSSATAKGNSKSGAGISSNGPASQPASSSPAPSSSATPASGQAGSTQLTNTGPGDTAAIFAASALIGSLGYRRYLIKKANT